MWLVSMPWRVPPMNPEALAARIASCELSYRMQAEAPELQEIDRESEATKKLYGIGNPITDDFGRQCLMARRLAEAGVRFVQISDGGWDHHASD